jgi:hypothetical protein
VSVTRYVKTAGYHAVIRGNIPERRRSTMGGMKDGDRFLRGLRMARWSALLQGMLDNNDIEYIPDWLYWKEWTDANKN